MHLINCVSHSFVILVTILLCPEVFVNNMSEPQFEILRFK